MLEYLPKFDLNEAETYIFFIFSALAILQLVYILFVYGRLAFHRIHKEKNLNNTPPVSIIIAARNESENLYQYLPIILGQDYPEFEVIVINHQSIDDSKYVLNAYAEQHKNLRIITVEPSKHMQFGKKLPLTLGIKGAKYEHLLFTDADCKPRSDHWLRSMAGRFSDKKQLVLGYGPYYRRRGFLNRLIRFDTAWIGISYLSMAKLGSPYMGIGRNLAYTKTAFNSTDGFKSHYSLLSGDDDLFIQEAAKKRNYTINIESDSFCYSKAAENMSSWTRQKSRHYTTSGRYKVFNKLMLGIYPLSLLLMLGTFVSLLFYCEYLWITLAVFLILLIVKWIVLGKAFKKLRETKFIVWLPLWDILYALWTPIMYYTVSKRAEKKW
ncbi:MAG: cellulose synthase/poly-beta-1,6-N-acetylglucosamine synthase-like glycosyltransferase [Flavobacteriaceae bacterium]|jgi:cellulose synthase/poly-beta-1,6-N-acetylglucosamine synthase-like glycosyltransferase